MGTGDAGTSSASDSHSAFDSNAMAESSHVGEPESADISAHQTGHDESLEFDYAVSKRVDSMLESCNARFDGEPGWKLL